MKEKEPLLVELQKHARETNAALAERTSLSEAEVAGKIAGWEQDGTILGYQAILDTERVAKNAVSAFIEVKMTPERGGGFDRLAMRISRFEQVRSCYLASGGYDLLVLVEGEDLRDVARFVAEKLSTLDGVISTATHFRLKVYKENGFLFEREVQSERLSVAP